MAICLPTFKKFKLGAKLFAKTTMVGNIIFNLTLDFDTCIIGSLYISVGIMFTIHSKVMFVTSKYALVK